MDTSNMFFKPTPLYKEFVILDLIEKNDNITQRQMSDHLSVSVSMINSYLDEYEKNGYIKREYVSSKNVIYMITKNGVARKQLLNIGFLNSSQHIYELARGNIMMFLNQIIERGFKNILLYGAGEVSEILLHVINAEKDLPINVIGVIDDNVNKQGGNVLNKKIYGIEYIKCTSHDGILVSSYTNRNAINKKLNKINYEKAKILNLF